jgi:hypothetical protein
MLLSQFPTEASSNMNITLAIYISFNMNSSGDGTGEVCEFKLVPSREA